MNEDSDREALLKAFGRRLREQRAGAGLSQEELAHLANLDRSYVGGAERGERNVSLINLVALARACGITVAKLLEDVETNADESEDL